MHDIESSLDEDNYEKNFTDLRPQLYTTYLGRPTKVNVVRVISWTSAVPQLERQPRSAVILGQPGVRGRALQSNTDKKCWDLFFSDHMLQMLVNYTNAKLRSVRQAYRLDFHKTDKEEMCAFVALMYLRGLLGMNIHKMSKLHEPAIGRAVFRTAMSKNCFKLLSAALRLDDHTTRPVKWKNVTFEAMREFFELFSINCSNHAMSLERNFTPNANKN